LKVPVTWLHYAGGDQEFDGASAQSARYEYPSGTFQTRASIAPVVLPFPLAESLLGAARAGDTAQLLELSAQIHEPSFASHLRLLISSYDYEAIIELVGRQARTAGNEFSA
jgi:hypothetical protein